MVIVHWLSGYQKFEGVGRRLAIAICYVGKFDANTRIGLLSDEHFEKIEKMIKDPVSAGIPKWMVNRCKYFRHRENIATFRETILNYHLKRIWIE